MGKVHLAGTSEEIDRLAWLALPGLSRHRTMQPSVMCKTKVVRPWVICGSAMDPAWAPALRPVAFPPQHCTYFPTF